MKKEKEQRNLCGRLLRPLVMGKGAVILADNLVYVTSHVIDISHEDDTLIQFETKNRYYSLSFAPFPPAATSPLSRERLAACA